MLGRVLRLLPDPGVMLHRRARDADLEVIKEQQPEEKNLSWFSKLDWQSSPPKMLVNLLIRPQLLLLSLCLLALSVHYVYLLGNCQKKPHKSEKMKVN